MIVSEEYYEEGMRCRENKNYTGAIASFKKAIHIDGASVLSCFGICKCFYSLQQYNEAMEWVDRSLGLDANNLNFLRKKGSILAKLEKYNEALTYYDKILATNPKENVTLRKKGDVLEILQRYEEAIVCYEVVITSNNNVCLSELSRLWNNKGFSLYKLNKYEDAVSCFTTALHLNQSNMYSWINNGNILSKQGIGSYKKAARCYNRAIKINRKYIKSWINKGHSLTESGDYTAAFVWYTDALLIYEQQSILWEHRGTNLYKVGKDKKANVCSQNSKFIEDYVKQQRQLMKTQDKKEFRLALLPI